MDGRRGPRSPAGEEPSSKSRRAARACLQCRARKQKCILPAEDDDDQSPCRRCKQLDIVCSFTTETPANADNPTPSRLAQLVTEWQARSICQEERIATLEQRLDNLNADSIPFEAVSNTPTGTAALDLPAQPDPSAVYPSPGMSFDLLDHAPPIATLRSLGAVGQGELEAGDVGRTSRQRLRVHGQSFSPVTLQLLTTEETRRAVQIFFDDCHLNAPFLNKVTGSSLESLQHTPRLLLTLCTIGVRYWTTGKESGSVSHRCLHPKYFDLVMKLDEAVAGLLLMPNSADLNLESLQILLLYTQWMPYGRASTADSPALDTSSKSRYNDLSAWAILGLASRYAMLLNIEQQIITTFHGNNLSLNQHSEAGIARLRVYNNLLICDYNLMLSSGLPASVDPAPANIANRVFEKSREVQPEDLQITALVQLAGIAHRAVQSSDNRSNTKLDARSLRKANVEFEDWEQSWTPRLANIPSIMNRMPFTSARWYRLALNSARLGPLLSTTSNDESQRISASLLESLEISLTAASQTLVALSTWGKEHVSEVNCHDLSTLPDPFFEADEAECDRLQFAVDSTWISHTFCITFLILCYIRGAIDDELSISRLSPTSVHPRSAASPPRPDSLLARLLRLGNDILNYVCQISQSHPAHQFRTVVRDSTALVMSNNGASTQETQELDFSNIQAFSDLMREVDLDWPGNLFDLDHS